MQWSYTWQSETQNTRCDDASLLQRVVDSVLFRITHITTPEQIALAQQSLLALKEDLIANMDPFHFPAFGTHRCVEKTYQEAKARLQQLAILPPPPPVQPSLRRQPQRSADGVVNDIASLADSIKRPQEILLGEERDGGNSPTGVSR
jgi:hypothetical protein